MTFFGIFFRFERVTVISIFICLTFIATGFLILLVPSTDPEALSSMVNLNVKGFSREVAFVLLAGMGVVSGAFLFLINKIIVKKSKADLLY